MSGVNNYSLVICHSFCVQIKCGLFTLVHSFKCKQRVVHHSQYILDWNNIRKRREKRFLVKNEKFLVRKVYACMGTSVINPLKHAFFIRFNGFKIEYSESFRVRIPYGSLKCKKLLDWDEIWYFKFLALLNTNPSSIFRNPNYQIKYGEPKCKKQTVILQRFLCGITMAWWLDRFLYQNLNHTFSNVITCMCKDLRRFINYFENRDGKYMN